MGTFVWYVEDRTEPDDRMLALFDLPPGDGGLNLENALATMIHPDDGERYATAVAAAMRVEGPRELREDIRVARGSGYRWLNITARSFFDGPPRLVGVATDVTDRHDAEERRAFLFGLSEALRSLTDPVEVQARAGDALGRRLAVDRALYLEVVHEPDSDYYLADGVRRYRADDFGATLFDDLRTGHTLVVADVTTDPRLSDAEREAYPATNIRAYAAVPLVKDGSHVAVLIVHQADPRVWTGAETTLLEEVAERTWAAVERARAERDLRAGEHRVALELQRALLPRAVLTSPRVVIAARYEAASEALVVGGDWYDAFDLPDGRIAVTVGDVVGHGLAAATAMGKLRVATVALAPHATRPGELLSRLDAFTAGSDGAEFATACYALFDPVTSQLRYASAGHPPMLVVGPDGSTRRLMGGRSGPFTGTVKEARPDAVEQLEPGSLLILYSDGLIERRQEPITTGLARLEAAAAALADTPADEACGRLLDALGVGQHREDDVVVLCMRVPVGFRDEFPAEPRQLSGLRRALTDWGAAQHLAAALLTQLVLAVNEAAANAVEHAYRGRPPGIVEVLVSRDANGDVIVTVRDFGAWREPSHVPHDRGRGTGIMRRLSHSFDRRSTPTGTTVRFSLSPIGSAA